MLLRLPALVDFYVLRYLLLSTTTIPLGDVTGLRKSLEPVCRLVSS